ncbi:MAG TPA: UDP-N-acetylmuramoyl-L-alanine--D-glutamate ligase, partial [Candidatus Limnocylindrales bacterium]|nr:UDP-N-acetylmuramoyl-L-alanine--D-glutamate ligase [Candidatus Limnocylindrales bacterium]
ASITRADLKGKRVTIVGLGKGRTSAGLARFLVSSGATVTITDAKSREALAEGIKRMGDTKVDLVLGPSSDDAALASADLVFVIPGVRPRSATLLRARDRGIPVLTEIGLFFRLCPAPIVAVTGTKGKTTTTAMLELILGRGPRRVYSGGNMGRAIIQELDTITKSDVVLLELSSFQLETLAMSPHIAVITNVSEDHLDHHGTRESYVAAKRNIVAWQGAKDVAVLNLDDPTVVGMHTGAASEVHGFSLTQRPKRGAFLDPNGMLSLSEGGAAIPLLSASQLKVPGRHNIANALAAAAAGHAAGVAPLAIGDALRDFEGVPRRLETVGEWNDVLYVNDSAATTPAATITAIAAFERPAVVILGGVGKGADFNSLAREVVKRSRGAVLIGQAADDIAASLAVAGKGQFLMVRALSMADAVKKASAMAHAGDVVLLSPACASFDMFSSADDRGDQFVAMVRAHVRGAGG